MVDEMVDGRLRDYEMRCDGKIMMIISLFFTWGGLKRKTT